MSRELRICPGVGGRKCGAFLSSLDRDPHPTCACDLTCDFCVGWSPAQWELFAKKRTYKERKRSHPSGSVPPAPGALPHVGTSSEVPQPGTSSSSSSRPSGGQDKGGGGGGESRGAPGVASREASSPPARPRSSERGGSVSGRLSVARERTSVSSALSGAAEREVARSQRTSPARAASSVAAPHSSQHTQRRDELREVSGDRSLSRSSRVSRSSDRGTRKDRRARSRSDSSRDRDRRSRSRFAYRSRLSGREHQRQSSSRSLSSRKRSRSSDRSRSRRVRSSSRGDRS